MERSDPLPADQGSAPLLEPAQIPLMKCINVDICDTWFMQRSADPFGTQKRCHRQRFRDRDRVDLSVRRGQCQQGLKPLFLTGLCNSQIAPRGKEWQVSKTVRGAGEKRRTDPIDCLHQSCALMRGEQRGGPASGMIAWSHLCL